MQDNIALAVILEMVETESSSLHTASWSRLCVVMFEFQFIISFLRPTMEKWNFHAPSWSSIYIALLEFVISLSAR